MDGKAQRPAPAQVGPPRQLRLPLDDEPVQVRPSLDRLKDVLESALREYAPDLSPPPVRVSARMTRTLGSFNPASKSITLSTRLLAHGTFDQCRSILLHELAHAIAHHRDSKSRAHGRAFREICEKLGVSPARLVKLPTEEWRRWQRFVYDCGRCGGAVLRKRAVRRVRCPCGAPITPKRVARVALSPGRAAVFIGYVGLERSGRSRALSIPRPPSVMRMR